ncbi:uncharacterized protein LOC108678051 [Hyalella azteca]|uniref:Uncharacterized protein LOC108678051 n=1 Tax=Hyalella azteca TaxID=294128 RepID=A0A8B7P6T6_HYAAZ|nr:uncharacterized protein LOC108678051 [Hyalella azteca]
MAAIISGEFLPNNAQWAVTGEDEAQTALKTLENTNNKPRGWVIVRSTATTPVLCLSQLLIKLAEASCDIDLRLLDSFWSHYPPPPDISHNRMGSFLRSGHGCKLRLFYGHLEAAALQSMPALKYIGLRLESATDVEVVNSAKCRYRAAAVSRNLKPEDITQRLTSGANLHCVDLEDGEVPWLLAVAEKLLTTDGRGHLYLPVCRLTSAGVRQLIKSVNTGILGVYLQSSSLTPTHREQLEVLAREKNKRLHWELRGWF